MSDAAPSIYPALRYRDAAAAIDWLCDAFGFERKMVVEGEGGRIEHAELSFGTGMIMLGSVRDVEKDPWPQEPGKSGIYVAVGDTDAHYDRARAAGAEIVQPIFDTDHGSRDYTCRDLEGNLWAFGTYQPTPA